MRKGLAGLLAAGGLAVSALPGCVSNTTLNTKINEALNTGYKIGHESGKREGREDQYNQMKGRVTGPLFVRESDTHELVYGRIDVLFDGNSYPDYLKSRSTPSDLIIMSDLRNIDEPEGMMEKMNGRAYSDLLWRGQVPTMVVTSAEGKERLDNDPKVQALLGRYLPPHSSAYTVKIVPAEQLRTVDPWEYTKGDLAKVATRKGTYQPGRIVYSEEDTSSPVVTHVPEIGLLAGTSYRARSSSTCIKSTLYGRTPHRWCASACVS
jgi:hypothetical protein